MATEFGEECSMPFRASEAASRIMPLWRSQRAMGSSLSSCTLSTSASWYNLKLCSLYSCRANPEVTNVTTLAIDGAQSFDSKTWSEAYLALGDKYVPFAPFDVVEFVTYTFVCALICEYLSVDTFLVAQSIRS